MARTLQLKWTDEDHWRSVRDLKSHEEDLDVIRQARADQDEVDRKYPNHKFSAEFRVIDPAALRRFSQIDV